MRRIFYQLIDGDILHTGDISELRQGGASTGPAALASGALLGGLLVGVGLMYLLDPEAGERRRDQFARRFRRERATLPALALPVRDQVHRTPMPLPSDEPVTTHVPVPDSALAQRVRAEMRHAVADPDAVAVAASSGVVTLRGSVPESELKPLLRRVAGVRGVEIIENQLSIQH